MKAAVAAFILSSLPGCSLLQPVLSKDPPVAPIEKQPEIDRDDLLCWSFDEIDPRCHYQTKNNAK